MAILDRECQASPDTLVRECQGTVAMNRGRVLVVLPTEVDTLLATQPTHNRTFHRVTPASLACLATLARPLGTLATTTSHSAYPKETTPPTMACLVLQVRSMMACPLTQEYHSQASLLDHLVHRVNPGLQDNKEKCMKDQGSLLIRVDHTCLVVMRS